MPQISKHRLSQSLENQMNILFRRSLADLRNECDVHDFLEDLLTPTEKIMLGKRLAIALFLDKGYDQRTIASIMKVSVATVSKVNYYVTHHGEGYRKVISVIRKSQIWQEFFSNLSKDLASLISTKKWHQMPTYIDSNEITPTDTL